jgi:hypothetical protein
MTKMMWIIAGSLFVIPLIHISYSDNLGTLSLGCSQTSNYPQEYLVNFGYSPDMKIIFNKEYLIFLTTMLGN